mmetsp:Transcript_4151/g.10664  ORF Transcript_4151/g.10664 Transcript_4151/m.10664 type:complete len:133 (+) Transcript_4151:329-727(+)
MPHTFVKHFYVEPNRCPLADPMTVRIALGADENLDQVRWRVQYVVDMASERSVIDLVETEPASVSKSESHVATIQTPAIDLSAFAQSSLLNLGLLMITLVGSDGVELLRVSAVTQVAKEGDTFVRTVLDPMS